MRSIYRDGGAGTLFLLLSAIAVGANTPEWNQQKQAGRKAYEQGRYVEAEALGRQALDLVQRTYSAESPEVAGCLNDLAVAYSALGKYGAAEDLYRKSLQIWEKSPGSEADQAR